MKEGLIRIDEVGRVVIPKEARKVLKITDSRFAQLYVERDRIIIKKYTPILNELQLASKVCQTLATLNSAVCLICDNERVICASGGASNTIKGKKLSEGFLKRASEGLPLLQNQVESTSYFDLLSGHDLIYYSMCCVSLEHEERIGYIIAVSLDKEQALDENCLKSLKLAKSIIEGIIS